MTTRRRRARMLESLETRHLLDGTVFARMFAGNALVLGDAANNGVHVAIHASEAGAAGVDLELTPDQRTSLNGLPPGEPVRLRNVTSWFVFDMGVGDDSLVVEGQGGKLTRGRIQTGTGADQVVVQDAELLDTLAFDNRGGADSVSILRTNVGERLQVRNLSGDAVSLSLDSINVGRPDDQRVTQKIRVAIADVPFVKFNDVQVDGDIQIQGDRIRPLTSHLKIEMNSVRATGGLSGKTRQSTELAIGQSEFQSLSLDHTCPASGGGVTVACGHRVTLEEVNTRESIHYQVEGDAQLNIAHVKAEADAFIKMYGGASTARQMTATDLHTGGLLVVDSDQYLKLSADHVTSRGLFVAAGDLDGDGQAESAVKLHDATVGERIFISVSDEGAVDLAHLDTSGELQVAIAGTSGPLLGAPPSSLNLQSVRAGSINATVPADSTVISRTLQADNYRLTLHPNKITVPERRRGDVILEDLTLSGDLDIEAQRGQVSIADSTLASTYIKIDGIEGIDGERSLVTLDQVTHQGRANIEVSGPTDVRTNGLRAHDTHIKFGGIKGEIAPALDLRQAHIANTLSVEGPQGLSVTGDQLEGGSIYIKYADALNQVADDGYLKLTHVALTQDLRVENARAKVGMGDLDVDSLAIHFDGTWEDNDTTAVLEITDGRARGLTLVRSTGPTSLQIDHLDSTAGIHIKIDGVEGESSSRAATVNLANVHTDGAIQLETPTGSYIKGEHIDSFKWTQKVTESPVRLHATKVELFDLQVAEGLTLEGQTAQLELDTAELGSTYIKLDGVDGEAATRSSIGIANTRIADRLSVNTTHDADVRVQQTTAKADILLLLDGIKGLAAEADSSTVLVRDTVAGTQLRILTPADGQIEATHVTAGEISVELDQAATRKGNFRGGGLILHETAGVTRLSVSGGNTAVSIDDAEFGSAYIKLDGVDGEGPDSSVALDRAHIKGMLDISIDRGSVDLASVRAGDVLIDHNGGIAITEQGRPKDKGKVTVADSQINNRLDVIWNTAIANPEGDIQRTSASSLRVVQTTNGQEPSDARIKMEMLDIAGPITVVQSTESPDTVFSVALNLVDSESTIVQQTVSKPTNKGVVKGNISIQQSSAMRGTTLDLTGTAHDVAIDSLDTSNLSVLLKGLEIPAGTVIPVSNTRIANSSLTGRLLVEGTRGDLPGRFVFQKIEIENVAVMGSGRVVVGGGDDAVRVIDSVFASLATFDGGGGKDQLVLVDNQLTLAPTLRNWESVANE